MPRSVRRRAILALLAIFVAMAMPEVARAAYGVSTLVIDAGSGRTLRATNADLPRYPASLTKMMTLYLLFDAFDRGTVRPDQRLRVSARAAAAPPTKLGLRPGQTITAEDAAVALATKSANDMTVVVAEALAGSEARFAQRMTAKARALGMRRTTFRNASGLHHPQQRTTARDMSVLARALLRDHPRHYRIFATRTFRYGGYAYANHNRLLGVYQGLDGIKTGYTSPARYNLVASAKRGGTRLIGVVLGSPTAASRDVLMTRLLDDGFRRTQSRTMASPASAAKQRIAAKSSKKTVAARAAKQRVAAKSSKKAVAAKAAKRQVATRANKSRLASKATSTRRSEARFAPAPPRASVVARRGSSEVLARSRDVDASLR